MDGLALFGDRTGEEPPVTYYSFYGAAADTTGKKTDEKLLWQGLNPEYDRLLEAYWELRRSYIDYQVGPGRIERFHSFGSDLFNQDIVLTVLLTTRPMRAVEIIENNLKLSSAAITVDDFNAAGNEIGAIFDGRQYRLPGYWPPSLQVMKLAA